MSFYGYETASARVRGLYEKLLKCWCAQTCAPRMRADWSPENPTLGQCSITSFLVQDILGGDVWGILLPDGGYHCFNEADGSVFDLTSGQFGGKALDYSQRVLQYRDKHFENEDKRSRYELLKKLFEECE